MADDEDPPTSNTIPSWQRSQPDTPSSAPPNSETTTAAPEQDDDSEDETRTTESEAEKGGDDDSLSLARRFLADPAVQSAPVSQKTSFLRSKGIPESDIQALLSDDSTIVSSSSSSPSTSSSDNTTITPSYTTEEPSRPPIITYPEFLQSSKSASSSNPFHEPPSPLVTTTRLLTTLQVAAALGSAIYGTSRFVLSPMLDTLNESRAEFHDAVSGNLASIITKLEGTVSEVPVTTAPSSSAQKNNEDDDSDTDDPSEMFHRDVGTQTSLPTTTSTSPTPPTQPTSDQQATQVATLTTRLSTLRDDIKSQSDDLGDVKALIDVFRDDLDVLTYRTNFADSSLGSYKIAGSSTNPKGDQKDEIHKARDNIRRIKGVLLSSKSFPVSTR